MKTIEYVLTGETLRDLISECTRGIEDATITTTRFDERLLRAAPELSEGVSERGNMFEAQALIHLAGRTAGLEDMVLHDAGMDRVPATLDVLRGVSHMAERKALARRNPDKVFTLEGLRSLLSLPRREGVKAEVSAESSTTQAQAGFKPWDMPRFGDDTAFSDLDFEGYDTLEDEPLEEDDAKQVRSQITQTRNTIDSYDRPPPEQTQQRFSVTNPHYNCEARLQQWLGVVEEVRGRAPVVLAATLALDAWLVLEPAEHRGEVGYALAAKVLPGVATAHLPTLGLGVHRGRFRWSPEQPLATRIGGLLAAISEAARRGTADLQRLTLARDVMLRACTGRSKNSRLPALVDLFMASPLVTVQMAAKQLGVSPQAVEAMLKELGPSLPRELTGRKRYRAWGVV